MCSKSCYPGTADIMFSLLRYFTHDTFVTEKPVQTRKEAVCLGGMPSALMAGKPCHVPLSKPLPNNDITFLLFFRSSVTLKEMINLTKPHRRRLYIITFTSSKTLVHYNTIH